jgi:hypothetical protein
LESVPYNDEVYFGFFNILRDIINEINRYVIRHTNDDVLLGITIGLKILWWNSSLACHMIVHGYETATKNEELLDEGRFDFLLSHHFKNYDMRPIYGLDHMFSYY